MTFDQLSAVLCPYGSHEGRRLDEIPVAYLRLMLERDGRRKPAFTRQVTQYLKMREKLS